MADFAHSDQTDITIVMNKVTVLLDLQMIEKYIKQANQIDSENVETPWLLQSKSYLKIIGILYLLENTNTPISADMVEMIIKSNYIFNNITVTFKPRIIKVFSKLDMAIIWLDIWDVQSRSKAKGLINRCFNVGNHIVTIHGANMNPGVS